MSVGVFSLLLLVVSSFCHSSSRSSVWLSGSDTVGVFPLLVLLFLNAKSNRVPLMLPSFAILNGADIPKAGSAGCSDWLSAMTYTKGQPMKANLIIGCSLLS